MQGEGQQSCSEPAASQCATVGPVGQICVMFLSFDIETLVTSLTKRDQTKTGLDWTMPPELHHWFHQVILAMFSFWIYSCSALRAYDELDLLYSSERSLLYDSRNSWRHLEFLITKADTMILVYKLHIYKLNRYSYVQESWRMCYLLVQ